MKMNRESRRYRERLSAEGAKSSSRGDRYGQQRARGHEKSTFWCLRGVQDDGDWRLSIEVTPPPSCDGET